MAYRINPSGGVVQVRTNPEKRYSTFRDNKFVPFLLKVRNIRTIRLNNGDRIVVREESLMIDTKEEFNPKATKLLHEHSNQKSAVIHGPVIVIHPGDWNT